MKLAVFGATGLVGSVILKVLAERNFPVTELIPVASEKSKGKKIRFHSEEYSIITAEEAINQKPDIAIFSAGGEASLHYAPLFAKAGTVVIDNSSAWRMHPDIKLIVPEINAGILTREDLIIANPNCSTIQMVMVLNPLHKKYLAKRLIISTYQSVTGTGIKAVRQMENERKGESGEQAYKYPIDKNCIPQCDVFLENGYTKEEMKLVNETRKILNETNLKITATAVRVPVMGGHSESINIEFEHEPDLREIRKILSETPGIIVLDDPENQLYPMPKYSEGKDEVFVGRIRKDDSALNAINLWITADNLRKGAATNAVQIAEYLLKNNLLKTS
jgi:aspartate-semialdehyde dehydrogenase